MDITFDCIEQMPLYETILMLPGGMKYGGLAKVMKDVCRPIVAETGVIRSIDNIGVKPMLNEYEVMGTVHRYGQCIRLRYDCNPLRKEVFEKEVSTNPFVFR